MYATSYYVSELSTIYRGQSVQVYDGNQAVADLNAKKDITVVRSGGSVTFVPYHSVNLMKASWEAEETEDRDDRICNEGGGDRTLDPISY